MSKEGASARDEHKGKGWADCEKNLGEHALKGDYWFILKAVGVNAPHIRAPRLSHTIHRIEGKDPASSDPIELLVETPTENTSARALRFEVLDMNEDLDTKTAVDCVLNSADGKAWLADAIDHAVFKVTIRKKTR